MGSNNRLDDFINYNKRSGAKGNMMSELDKQEMINSFNNISFHAKRRGEQEYFYYSELLKDDLQELGENQGNYPSSIVDDVKHIYETRFISKVMDYFHSQMNCASAFICGPANFNNRRNEKLWKWRDNKLDHFTIWRKGYFKAVNRVRTLSPEAEIDVAIERLEYLETEKAKPIKYNHRTLEDRKLENTCGVYNVTLKIREAKNKIKVMKDRIEAKENYKPTFFKGGVITIENDRVVIKHDEKPDKEIIQAIKKHGFCWSPKMGNWCRKHTGNARHDANSLLENILGGEIQGANK